jgi:hypothetical protein
MVIQDDDISTIVNEVFNGFIGAGDLARVRP